MSRRWETILYDDFYLGEAKDCRFCGKELGSVRARRQHESYHIIHYTCKRCPTRNWSSLCRAKGHATGHAVVPSYHPPRCLADQRPLLAPWGCDTLLPSIRLRRVQAPSSLPSSTPQPAIPVSSSCDLPSPADNGAAPETKPHLAELADTPLLWEQGDINETLEALFTEMGQPAIEDFPDEMDEALISLLEKVDSLPAADILPPAASQPRTPALLDRMKEARRDISTAENLLTSARQHLDVIEGVLAMEAETQV